jgi:hypothetical protein
MDCGPRSRRSVDEPCAHCVEFGELGRQVDGGAVAVGVMAALARGADAQVVAAQDPDDVVIEAGVDRLGRVPGRHRPARQSAVRARRGQPARVVQVDGPYGNVDAAGGAGAFGEGRRDGDRAETASAVALGAGEDVVDVNLGVV